MLSHKALPSLPHDRAYPTHLKEAQSEPWKTHTLLFDHHLPLLGPSTEKDANNHPHYNIRIIALLQEYHSGWKSHSSTEKSTIQVLIDVLKVTHSRNIFLRIPLNLLADFNTIYHQALLKLLNARMGFDGTALQ